MKKFTKVSMATALVASALTPVAAFAAEADQAPAGFYNVNTGEVVLADAFAFLDPAKKLEILNNTADEFYFLDGAGKALNPKVLLTAETNEDVNAALEDEATVEERHDVKFTEGGEVVTPTPAVVVVDSVTATTDEKTGETTVTAKVANAEEGATATVTVTPDAALEADKIVTEDVAIDAEGNVELNLGVLPAGTHSVVVTVGEVSSEAFEFTVEQAVLTVESVMAINSTKLSVTFEGVDEPVEIELEEALVHGDNEVTFTYEGVEYTETVNYVDSAVVALEKATEAVEDFEANVDSVEKVTELVTDRDKREEVAKSFVPATNAIQDVKGDAKEELLKRLDAANDVVIAAGSVNSLQSATKELTAENLEAAQSQLTKTQNLVNHVVEGDVKKALTALANAEKEKIDAVQSDVDAAAKLAKAIADAEEAIAALPTDEISLADKEDVEGARALVKAALELDENAVIANLDILEAVEEAIKQLEADEEAAAKLAAAKSAAEAAIADLPSIEELTLENEEVVDAARQLVADFVDLGGEEADIENLAALEAVEDQIEALHVQAEFDALLAEAQEKVDALTLATSSLTKLDTQEKVDNALSLSATATSAIETVIAANEDYDVSALAIAKDEANEMITEALKVLEATGLVEMAKETKLDDDYNAAKAKVDTLQKSQQKTVLNAELIELEAERKGFVDAVKAAVTAENDIDLNDALATGPFDYDDNRVAEYNSALKSADSINTITEVQAVIDQVNETAAGKALAKLVQAAKKAVTAVEEGDFAGDQEEFDALVTAAQTAIDALPADYTEEDAEAPLAQELQIQLDAQKKLNSDFVNLVTAINDAAKEENQIQLNKALNAANINAVNTAYIQEYITAIDGKNFTTLEKIQNAVDIVNATVSVEGLTTTNGGVLALAEGVGQDEISAAKSLVEALPDTVDPETGEATPGDVEAGLLEDIAVAQAFVDALNIKDQAGLNAALENDNIVNLKLVKSFETTEKINIMRAVSIDGGNNTITFTSDATDWNSNFVLQVYNTGEGTTTISNLKLTGADGGLLVNGAKVVLSGTIDVSGNEFGGIESGKGSDVETNPSLDVTNATLVNTTEAYGLPTVWEDGVTETVVGFEGTEITKGSQPQYYLVEENSIDPLPAQQEAAVTAAEEAIANLPTVEDLTLEDTVAVEAARALVIEAKDLNESAEIEGVEKLEALEAQLPILAEQDKVADILAAESAAELQPLLVNLNQGVYNNLTSVQRLEVANLFLDTLAEGTFESLQSISEALVNEIGVKASDDTDATGYFALLAVVNEATSITGTRDALAELGNETFGTMSASEKLVAAENVLNAKPETGYSSIAQIANNFTAQ